MRYDKGPSVVRTSPAHHDLNVDNNSTIKIWFDKDIAKSSLAGNININNRAGEQVDCKYRYANRIVEIELVEPLKHNETYRVVINGDNDPDNPSSHKGVTSPVGTSMLGDYEFTFTTFAPAMEAEIIYNLTPNNIVLDCPPTLKGDFTTKTINAVSGINIEIGTSNTFEAATIIWSGECSPDDFQRGFSPKKELFDGSYYWRARTISNNLGLIYGEWSEGSQFAIELHNDATVVADDYVDVDIAFPDSWGELEPNIIEVFPDKSASNVNTNTKTLSIVLDQIVPEETLRSSYITLTGEAVDGDIESESHGELDIDLNIVYNHEIGTTTIIITLPEIGGDQ